jgi:hypothetical protein
MASTSNRTRATVDSHRFAELVDVQTHPLAAAPMEKGRAALRALARLLARQAAMEAIAAGAASSIPLDQKEQSS